MNRETWHRRTQGKAGKKTPSWTNWIQGTQKLQNCITGVLGPRPSTITHLLYSLLTYFCSLTFTSILTAKVTVLVKLLTFRNTSTIMKCIPNCYVSHYYKCEIFIHLLKQTHLVHFINYQHSTNSNLKYRSK